MSLVSQQSCQSCRRSLIWKQLSIRYMYKTIEPVHEKTNNLGSDQV